MWVGDCTSTTSECIPWCHIAPNIGISSSGWIIPFHMRDELKQTHVHSNQVTQQWSEWTLDTSKSSKQPTVNVQRNANNTRWEVMESPVSVFSSASVDDMRWQPLVNVAVAVRDRHQTDRSTQSCMQSLAEQPTDWRKVRCRCGAVVMWQTHHWTWVITTQLNSIFLKRGKDQSCYWSLIGSCKHVYNWYQSQRPWMTLNGHYAICFKMHVSFRAHHQNMNYYCITRSPCDCTGFLLYLLTVSWKLRDQSMVLNKHFRRQSDAAKCHATVWTKIIALQLL